MITNAANALALSSVLAVTLDEIDILSLRNVSGEYYRMTVTNVTQITSTKYEYTFYMSESVGNGSIVEVALHGNGATVTLNSGTTYATQALTLTKNNTQSLTIIWTVEVV
jgi:hypothetical protein